MLICFLLLYIKLNTDNICPGTSPWPGFQDNQRSSRFLSLRQSHCSGHCLCRHGAGAAPGVSGGQADETEEGGAGESQAHPGAGHQLPIR